MVLAQTRGGHYWCLPSLAFAWSLIWMMRQRESVAKAIAIVFLCAMCLGVIRNWELPAFKDLHFAEYARSFEGAPAGTVMVIPENPEGWTMQLVKKPIR
jgi:hypothetical protein